MEMVLAMIIICGQAYAKKNPEILPSLEWQKSILKNEIESKIQKVLSTMLKQNEYFVHVAVELAIPEMPDFYKKNGSFKENEKSKNIRPSTAAEQDPYGYVVFQKMGLEAPLLEDFKEKIGPIQDNRPSPFENIWKYNNAVDIFKNIPKVTDNIQTLARELLEKLVKEINFDIPNQTPTVAFEYIDFKLSRIPPPLVSIPTDKDPQWKSVLAILEKFQLPIGLIMAVCLLGIFGFMLLKRYQQILEDTDNSQNITMENNSQENGDGSADGIGAADIPVPMSQTVLERFIAYFENAPKECISLMRTWIREASEAQSLALSYLVEELPNDKLTALVANLPDEERAKLRALVISSLKPSDISKAKDFVGIQIRDEILKGEKIEDPELQDMLLSLSPTKAAELIQAQPKSISYLFSKLTAQFLGLILDHLPDDKKAVVLSEAMNTTQGFDIKALKMILPKFIDVELFSPGLE